jgi:CheY-like chemotaxis protein
MPATTCFDGRGPAVLVVEDEFFIRTAVTEALRDVGCTVYEAMDYTEAVDLLASHGDVEATITDISMPGPRNGNDLIGVIREEYPNLIVVAATGTSIHGLVDGVLRKPYDPADAAALVRELVGRRRSENIKQRLEDAERQVAESKEQVQQQLALVDRLSAGGHDTADARSILTQFEELLLVCIAKRNRLQRQISGRQ